MTGLLLVLPPVTQDSQNSNFVLQKQKQNLSQIETDLGLRYISTYLWLICRRDQRSLNLNSM